MMSPCQCHANLTQTRNAPRAESGWHARRSTVGLKTCPCLSGASSAASRAWPKVFDCLTISCHVSHCLKERGASEVTYAKTVGAPTGCRFITLTATGATTTQRTFAPFAHGVTRAFTIGRATSSKRSQSRCALAGTSPCRAVFATHAEGVTIATSDKQWDYRGATQKSGHLKRDGVSRGVLGLTRRQKLKMLGNAVVPAQVQPILEEIARLESGTTAPKGQGEKK